MLQKSLPQYLFINSGKGGDTLAGALARLDDAVLQYRPFAVIIGIGANDYWRRKRSIAELKRDYETIVKRCSDAGIRVLIISCFGNDDLPEGEKIDFAHAGLPHAHYAAALARIERELVARYRCGYVPDMQIGITPKGRRDLWSDRNHPNAAGNRIVADTILVELTKLLARGNDGGRD